ncbi:hypothetical protein FIBSPDRAFT_965801 [Athelia psychrophila]|uniref:Uncharacterized protein n=1 Tax=Athelia psychrophila TaxID=1759441 RepID=A0A167XIJ5_9AGAM|nr:hypothetical protein FIBSPDRAFT_965801 [Fibularhizoctonia sp. CBS 109695]
MLFSIASIIALSCLAVQRVNAESVSTIPAPPPDTAGAVWTATSIFNTIIDASPYLIQATTTVVWTESATPTTTPTNSS